MTLLELKLTLPDDVAQKAEASGLLTSEAIADLLKEAVRRQQIQEPLAGTDLWDEPFIGMWRDREELSDSSQWVRQVRVQEWQ